MTTEQAIQIIDAINNNSARLDDIILFGGFIAGLLICLIFWNIFKEVSK